MAKRQPERQREAHKKPPLPAATGPCPKCHSLAVIPVETTSHIKVWLSCAVCDHVWGTSKAAPECPKCHSSNTENLPLLSARDPKFAFFMCGDCDYAWKVTQAHAAAPE